MVERKQIQSQLKSNFPETKLLEQDRFIDWPSVKKYSLQLEFSY